MQVAETAPAPLTIIPFSPLPVSQIATLEDNLDLPLMWAAGIVRPVRVYPDNLMVEGHLEPVPSCTESQFLASL